jgi:hypothetical protein
MLIAHWGHEKLQWPTMDPFAVIENDQLEQDQLRQTVPGLEGKIFRLPHAISLS